MTKEEFDNLQPGDWVTTSYGFDGYVTMVDRAKNYYIAKSTDREELQFWHQGTLTDPPVNQTSSFCSGMGYLSYETTL